MPRCFAYALGFVLATVALVGCTEPAASRLRLADEVERPPRNVVVFFADGMDTQRLREMLEVGLLPNIRRTFVEGGVQVRDAISSMPSVTYPNCSAIMTGCFPGHHGILGNFWLDRSQLLVHYYMTLATSRDVNGDLQRATIYDMLSDRFTVSILQQTHKGVTESFDVADLFALGWIVGDYIGVDREVHETFPQIVDLANRTRRWPTMVMTYYPGVDELGHRRGPDSSQYAAALKDIDDAVGQITGQIDKLGLTQSTYFVLIADHGMVPRTDGQDFDFIKWLRKGRRLKVLNEPLRGSTYADRFAALQPYDAVATVDAGRVAMVHLRGKNWTTRLEPQAVRSWAMAEPAIHELPAVEMVAARGGPNRAMVWSRHGSFIVERQSAQPCPAAGLDGKQYRVVEYTGDPLFLQSQPALGEFTRAGWHTSREWLAASASSRYPDIVPQVVEMFDSAHTGDLVVFAAEDWLLYPTEWAGHGSTLYRDMHVPMFFTGPDLPAGTQIPLGRLVDLVPTLLGLLGEADRLQCFPPIDGIDLSDQLRQAKPAQQPMPAPTPPRPGR